MLRIARWLLVLAAIAVLSAVSPIHRAALRAVGSTLVRSDPVESGDLVVISESGTIAEFQAAEIEVADLYARRLFPRVMILRPAPDVMDSELQRRGVRLEDPVVVTLQQLGVPTSAVTLLNAGEGGTTESTRALAAWAAEHPSRVLVVIGASHSQRYRRALLRVWPSGVPAPRVTFPQRTTFHPEDWWTSRRTLREGVFELQKLWLDVASHPW